jgi:hypothetical protein
MEIDWKDGMAEFFGCLVFTWVLATAAADGGAADTLLLGVALIVIWATFSGAHIIPALTVGKMFNDQDWEGGGTKLVWQILGTVGAGVLGLLAGADAPAQAAADAFAFDVTQVLTMVVGGGVLYMVWTRCDAWVTAFGVAIAAGAMTLDGGVSVGGMLGGLASGNSFDINTLVAYVYTMVLAGAGAMIAVKVDEQL